MARVSEYVYLGILVLPILSASLTCSDMRDASGEYTDLSLSVRPPSPSEERMWEGPTPDEMLAELVESYETKNLSAYESPLSEQFLFHFVQEIAESLGMPPDQPWWGKTEDVNSTRHMFESPEVSIEMDLARVSDWHACTDSVSGRQGLCCNAEPDIRVTVNLSGLDPFVLRVNNSIIEVVLVVERARPGLLTILAIKERTKDPDGDPTGTWSALKALFR